MSKYKLTSTPPRKSSIRWNIQVYLQSEEWEAKKKSIDYSKIKKYRYRYKSDENFDNNIEQNKIRLEDEILKQMLKDREITRDTREESFMINFNKIPLSDRYQSYSSSSEWSKISRLLRKCFKNCVLCGSTEKLCVHHLTYDNLNFLEVGNEYFSDVSVICKKCHTKCHSRNNKVFQLILESNNDYDVLVDILNRSKFGKYSDIDILANIKSNVRLKDLYWDSESNAVRYKTENNT